ncbi:MAG: hypothetical protein RDU01_01745 [Thermodesulfovibrionales bacterium]|nr:hypothetical protein [Thermodesulfovibrionales bacterium]
MTVETILLILESLLLGFTIILLLFSIKEGRGRKNLLLEVEKTTKVLTRQEYFLTVMDAMLDAREEVAGFITGRLPTGDDTKRTRAIMNNIERLSKEGVSVKYIMPKFHDRIHIGNLYTKAGAHVKYSTCAIVHDFRYIVVDDRIVVIGMPESTGEKEATRKGYRIPSEGLSAVLKEYFYKCWEENIDHADYVKEVMKQTGASLKVLAQELQISEEDLEKIASEAK